MVSQWGDHFQDIIIWVEDLGRGQSTILDFQVTMATPPNCFVHKKKGSTMVWYCRSFLNYISCYFTIYQERPGKRSGTQKFLLLQRSLYILSVLHRFYFTTNMPSNPDYIEEGESTSSYSFTPRVGYFACPGIDTQVQGISVLRLILMTRQSK
jgi:hypothetical protein